MRVLRTLPVCALALLVPAVCRADNFSFNGSFTADNDVQAFTFTVGATSTVTLRTWSYAGGVDAAGMAVPAGGFDPVLALFSGTGSGATLVGQNDDGTNVAVDPTTGKQYDTYLQESNLAPGTYAVTVTEYDNVANGPTLGDGFAEGGSTDFTSKFGCSNGMFCDISIPPVNNRTPNWEFDIDGVLSASEVGATPAPTPEPSSFALLGTAVLGAAGALRRRFRA